MANSQQNIVFFLAATDSEHKIIPKLHKKDKTKFGQKFHH